MHAHTHTNTKTHTHTRARITGGIHVRESIRASSARYRMIYGLDALYSFLTPRIPINVLGGFEARKL